MDKGVLAKSAAKQGSVGVHELYKVIDKQERERIIIEAAKAFGDFLKALKIDWAAGEQTEQTPMRVATMYVDEWLGGRFCAEPELKFFKCIAKQDMLVHGPIAFSSLCPHHFTPFVGFVSLALEPFYHQEGSEVLGISKYARLVHWYSGKAYMQEDLGSVLLVNLAKLTKSEKVGVFVCARHRCCTHRGVNQTQNQTVTLHMGRAFEQDAECRREFSHITQIHMQQFTG